MKVNQYSVRAHLETRAQYLVCEKTFNSKDEMKLDNPKAIEFFLNEYADAAELPNEKTWLFCLDNAARLIGFSELTQGTDSATIFDVKRALQIALMTGASAIAVAHNHPSGSLEPSGEDCGTTNRMNEACKLLGITLVDHVIVSYKGYYSFREGGRLM